MKLRLLAATAAFGLAAAANANAAITVVAAEANNLFGPLSYGQEMLHDFDGFTKAYVAYVGDVRTSIENPISTSAPPPWEGGVTACCDSGGDEFEADPTNYASVQGGDDATFTLTGRYLTSFSFYMGSPDSYNHVRFHLLGGGFQDFDGDEIWGGPSVQIGNGDRTKGFRVYYDFGGAKVSGITFSSDTNAFEFDSLAGTAVPEPAAWALMIGGFGFAGGMLRRRKAALA